MSKTLVLGANGFIGSHLVDSLAEDGHSVRAFGRFSSGDYLFQVRPEVEVYPGDFLNTSDLKDALKDVEYVFHFISTTTPASAENDPLVDIETNIRMSVELLKLCVEEKVKRVIFASTGGAIYGAKDIDKLHNEEDLPLPVSPYAIGKLTIEQYLRYFRVKHNLDSVSLRISNPYGERQPFHRKQGVIPIFIENIVRNNPITLLGDGTMVRDYIYVKDLTSMIAKTFHGPLNNHTYNLGSGNGVSLNELLDVIKNVVEEDITIDRKPVPSTFLKKVVLDTSRFKSEFNLSPQTSLRDGIADTYNYIKNEIGKE